MKEINVQSVSVNVQNSLMIIETSVLNHIYEYRCFIDRFCATFIDTDAAFIAVFTVNLIYFYLCNRSETFCNFPKMI